MRYEYIEAYVLTGFGKPQVQQDAVLYSNPNGTAAALIASDLDTYLAVVDRDGAVCSFVLIGLFHAARSDERPVKMAEIIKSRRELRAKFAGHCPLIVKFTGEVEIFPDDPNHPDRKLQEVDDYLFGWDLIDKDDIRDAHKQELTKILACNLAASPLPTQLRSLENGIYFFTSDNRRLFLGFWQVGSAIITRSLFPDELARFQIAFSSCKQSSRSEPFVFSSPPLTRSKTGFGNSSPHGRDWKP